MAITAAQVKELREQTGIPMMKCKKALEACDGDMGAAVELLRKQGEQTAASKSARATKSGAIGVAVNDQAGVLVCVACETDFVAGNDEFKTTVDAIAAAALAAGVTDASALESVSMADGRSVGEAITGLIAKLGENMKLVDMRRLDASGIAVYNHGGRIATLVAGSGDAEVLRQVAMHVAAANPPALALDRDGVDQDVLAKERAVLAASDEVMAKPEAIRDKIVEGKLKKFYQEQVLLEQDMLLYNDDGQTVGDWAKAKGVTITGFTRLDV